MVIKYNCVCCKRIMIKDIEEYLKKYPDEKWVMCPYCGFHILIEKIKEDVLK